MLLPVSKSSAFAWYRIIYLVSLTFDLLSVQVLGMWYFVSKHYHQH